MPFQSLSLPKGDTFQITIGTDVLASGQTLNLFAQSKALALGPFALTWNGTAYTVSVTTATTANWATGEYTLLARTAAEPFTSKTVGVLTVVAALTGAGTTTHAQRMLAAIEATLEGRATHDVDEYEIKGRRLRYLRPDELRKWRAEYRREVAQEKAAMAGRSPTPKIFTRF